MKSLIFIISIYFIFLAILPCHCSIYIQEIDNIRTEKVMKTHSESDFEFEKCTPFCACASYHNPIFVEKEVGADIQHVNLSGMCTISVYNENKTTSHLERLLRPPQA